jgi:hypothetical protein
MTFELPNLADTEAAEIYGRDMTRDQWLLCEGAKQALEREFRSEMDRPAPNAVRRMHNLDRAGVLATKVQLFREAQEVAPFPTLCALSIAKRELG